MCIAKSITLSQIPYYIVYEHLSGGSNSFLQNVYVNFVGGMVVTVIAEGLLNGSGSQ